MPRLSPAEVRQMQQRAARAGSLADTGRSVRGWLAAFLFAALAYAAAGVVLWAGNHRGSVLYAVLQFVAVVVGVAACGAGALLYAAAGRHRGLRDRR